MVESVWREFNYWSADWCSVLPLVRHSDSSTQPSFVVLFNFAFAWLQLFLLCPFDTRGWRGCSEFAFSCKQDSPPIVRSSFDDKFKNYLIVPIIGRCFSSIMQEKHMFQGIHKKNIRDFCFMKYINTRYRYQYIQKFLWTRPCSARTGSSLRLWWTRNFPRQEPHLISYRIASEKGHTKVF